MFRDSAREVEINLLSIHLVGEFRKYGDGNTGNTGTGVVIPEI